MIISSKSTGVWRSYHFDFLLKMIYIYSTHLYGPIFLQYAHHGPSDLTSIFKLKKLDLAIFSYLSAIIDTTIERIRIHRVLNQFRDFSILLRLVNAISQLHELHHYPTIA
jgi:hypothetical protein